jgi:hypothetical protein
LRRVDILEKRGNSLRLIEVKAKSVDTSTGENPFRGVRGNISSNWQEYLQAEITPYLCLVDKSKTTTIHSLFSKFQLSTSNLDEARFRRPTVAYTGDADELRRNHFLSELDVAAEVHELLPGVESSSAEFVASLKNGVSKIQVPINVGCRGCEYRLVARDISGDDCRNGFAECWGNLANEDPHILDYYHVSGIGGRSSPVVNALIRRGRAKLSDVEESDLSRADETVGPTAIRQRMQREYTLACREYLDPALKQRLEQLQYPLHFIDFETSSVAVPYYIGMRPYELVAFQWSCHTIRERGAPLEHAHWINVVDAFPNFEFARALMEHLGESGTFLIWSLHENTVLNTISRQMHRYRYSDPQLEKWLDTVTNREGYPSPFMVDMCALAKEGYFHPKMKGKLFLKYVLPAVWEGDDSLHSHLSFAKYHQRSPEGAIMNPYDTLPALPFGNPDEDEETEQVVTEGVGAMRAYQEMVYGVSRHNEVLKEQWRRLLLQYCELDTLAMVMVWTHWTK